jgi:hypothetical protein
MSGMQYKEREREKRREEKRKRRSGEEEKRGGGNLISILWVCYQLAWGQ